jgi:hypothetical protein
MVRIEGKSALVDTYGTITIEIDRVPAREEWWIQAIAVQCSSTSQTTFTAYRNQIDFLNVIDMTERGNFNVADEASPKWIGSGSTIVVQWTGCSATDSLGNPSKGEVTMQIAKRQI